MKKQVSVPSMRSPTPWNSRPNSLAEEKDQASRVDKLEQKCSHKIRRLHTFDTVVFLKGTEPIKDHRKDHIDGNDEETGGKTQRTALEGHGKVVSAQTDAELLGNPKR